MTVSACHAYVQSPRGNTTFEDRSYIHCKLQPQQRSLRLVRINCEMQESSAAAPQQNEESDDKNTDFVSVAFYNHGLFCATHPKLVIFVTGVIILACRCVYQFVYICIYYQNNRKLSVSLVGSPVFNLTNLKLPSYKKLITVQNFSANLKERLLLKMIRL